MKPNVQSAFLVCVDKNELKIRYENEIRLETVLNHSFLMHSGTLPRASWHVRAGGGSAAAGCWAGGRPG